MSGVTGIDPRGPVFISYRQSDGTALARELAGLLRAAGVPVWQDVSDLPPGDTEHRLREAMRAGLSGAVLLVTPEMARSGVVRTIEFPTLHHLSNDEDFVFVVGNTLRTAAGHQDYAGPDRLLGKPAGTLSAFNQTPVEAREGLLRIVRDVLLSRASRAGRRLNAGEPLVISVQTRGRPDGSTPVTGDLSVRLSSPPSGRLPDPSGLADLRDTLPLLSDAVPRSGAESVLVTGGAHLSVAYALGSALPTTLVGDVSVRGTASDVWRAGTVSSFQTDLISIPTHHMSPVQATGTQREVLAYVDLLPGNSDAAFTRFLDEHGSRFDTWEQIRPLTDQRLDSAQAGPLVDQVAGRLRDLVQRHDNAHLHLLLRCPYPVAVLLGRLSNTLAVTVYEWDDEQLAGDPDARPRFVPSLSVRATHAGGPISDVLLTHAGASA